MVLILPTKLLSEDGVLLQLKNGTTLGFAFREKPVMVTSDNLIMKVDGHETVSFPFQHVRSAFWGDISHLSAGIQQPKPSESNLVFSFTGSYLCTKGLAKGESVTVYNTDGKLLAAGTSTSENGTIILHTLTTGEKVSIVRTSSGIAYKLLRTN